jgi:two-component system OmpR family response regulator
MQAATTVYWSSNGSGLPPAATSAMPEPAASTTAAVHKVLVVDDERDLADLAGALLECQGLEAVVVYSADEALHALARHDDIDALFSDIMMPGMTGLQLADTVRRLYPGLTILLTSGFTAPALLAGQHGSYRCLAKPYQMDAVIKALNGQA